MDAFGIQAVGTVSAVIVILLDQSLAGAYLAPKSTIGLVVPDFLETAGAQVTECRRFQGVALAGEDFSVCSYIGEIPGGVAGDIVLNPSVPAVVEQHCIDIIDDREIIQLFLDLPEGLADFGCIGWFRYKLG